MSNQYLDQFFKLKCCGDVLNSVSTMSKATKEITESMAVIKYIKKIVLPEPMKYDVLDLCAGNALTSVLSVFMLPVRNAIAVDKHKRKGHYEKVKRFCYHETDISKIGCMANDITISVHPCQTADLVVEMWNNSNSKALVLIPCCNGNFEDVVARAWLREKMSQYDVWTYHLASKIKEGKVSVVRDPHILSPRNNVIIAVR